MHTNSIPIIQNDDQETTYYTDDEEMTFSEEYNLDTAPKRILTIITLSLPVLFGFILYYLF